MYAIGCPKATLWLCLSVLTLFFLSHENQLLKRGSFINNPFLHYSGKFGIALSDKSAKLPFSNSK